MARARTLQCGDPAAFDEVCERLARAVSPFRPDVVIGIATGGAHVAENLRQHLEPAPIYIRVQLSRPGTEAKQRVNAGALLSRLPTPVADTLRWLEVEAREAALRRTTAKPMLAAEDLFPTDATSHDFAAGERVLVVDDTVDTGRTLQTVVSSLSVMAPDVEVRTAVITSTFRRPPVRPDYCLYERTRVRFPWSMDA